MIESHSGDFVWSLEREQENLRKHGVGFSEAARAFVDPGRKIFSDIRHSSREEWFFCVGKVGDRVLTVRFSKRDGKIRIFGAGYWRKGERRYEAENA